MYTVKKFKKNEIIMQNLDIIAPSTCYAVIDHAGKVVISSVLDVQIYWRESTALQVADWYNKQQDEPVVPAWDKLSEICQSRTRTLWETFRDVLNIREL